MAGPSGTKLIDLHMTDRGQTTEMFSPSRKVGSESKLRKDADSASHDIGRKLANAGRSIVVFLVHLAVICLSFFLAQDTIAALKATSFGLADMVADFGRECAVIVVTVLISVVILFLLELLGVLRAVRQGLKFADPLPLEKDGTASDLMKVKPSYIHFGHLPVTYDITEKGLLIRSLGDRFVAVLAISPEAKVKLAPEQVEASYRGWYGDDLTPPVVIEVEDGAYESKLLISGFHFETPKAGHEHNIKCAEAFRDALTHRPAAGHGGHDDHH